MLNKTVFERYLVSAQMYENDLSILYVGKDTQTSQTIFLTVIKSGIVPTADFLSRFKSMPQGNSALAVKLLEVGEADGQAVIVWEGGEGKSLADLTADGIGLPLERCLDLARQLGSHLETLHNQKALQGVFLPEDIFLLDENTLWILNLGIWNPLSFKSAPTPYLAPELIRGEQASVRSDIYSLGALLYKILTGTAPGADPFPSRTRSDVPSDWDELVSRCLNLDSARRVQSAAEFLGKLDEIGRATKFGQGKLMGMEDSLVGHTLGAYRLVERLGQGGMATVYKAYEAALDRYVAIKVLPQFFANDPTFAQRFRREAKAIAQLNHPNIVPIYSFGEDNGITYIAMQFIEGGTLKHASDQVYRSEEALRLLLPIARALGYAHKRGVIHRDIKPSNVLISDEGWPVLADFGLAQMAQASARLTESGVGMGTPTYMSPEQGQGDRVDQRTDIYSFGIMLYELVTGEAPFRADTPMAVVIKHLTAPMPLPSDVNPNVPPEVETLILKATAKNPDDRFQTAEELALAMERALNLPSVMKEERTAEPSVPQYSATVVARPPAPTVAAHPPATTVAEPAATPAKVRKSGKIFRTLGIALLVLLGLPCLCVVGMYALNICPPEGPWDQPPWCAGSRYVAPFIDTPVVEQQSLCLDGIDSYVEIPYSKSLALEQALTLEAWVQVSSFAVKDCSVYGLCGSVPIINQGHRGSSAGNYTLFVSPEQLGFVFQPLDSKLTAPVHSWQEWNHIAVTHTFGNGRESRMYLNGEPLEQLQWTNDKGELISGADPFPNQVSPYYFGKMEPNHLFFSGCIDEIRIWDHVRTQEEIQKAMHAELRDDEEGLAGYWKFNDAEDSTLIVDSSPNGNDGRLFGDARLQTTNVPISQPRR